MMKNIFHTLRYLVGCAIIFLSTAMSENVSAQSIPADSIAILNPQLLRYYSGCNLLVEGLEQNSESTLRDAATLLDERKDNPDKLKINDLKVKIVENADTVSMLDHIYFSGDYALHCLRNTEDTYIPKASSMRGYGKTGCYAHNDAIKANGKITYRVIMQDDCQLLVIGEKGARLKVIVSDAKSGNEQVANSYNNDREALAFWTQGPSPIVLVTVQNLTDKDVSFVMATN